MVAEGNGGGDDGPGAAVEAARRLLIRLHGEIERALELLEDSRGVAEVVQGSGEAGSSTLRSRGDWQRWLPEGQDAVDAAAEPSGEAGERWMVEAGADASELDRDSSVEEKWAPPPE